MADVKTLWTDEVEEKMRAEVKENPLFALESLICAVNATLDEFEKMCQDEHGPIMADSIALPDVAVLYLAFSAALGRFHHYLHAAAAQEDESPHREADLPDAPISPDHRWLGPITRAG